MNRAEFDAHLEAARCLLREADYRFTDGVYGAVRRLFLLCAGDPETQRGLAGRTPEFGQEEFFLNTDDEGRAVSASRVSVEDYRATCRTDREFARWLREADGDEPRLLVARWLAHFLGFRHRCVHLFLDHPALDDATFVQVRSLGKYQDPGRLDVPVAGHVKGTATLRQSAAEELAEELGLKLARDVEDLREIGRSSYVSSGSRSDFHNIEHETVYRGRLTPDALCRLRFPDGEVAAVALFKLSELRTLLREYPERAAAGLVHHFRLYEADIG